MSFWNEHWKVIDAVDVFEVTHARMMKNSRGILKMYYFVLKKKILAGIMKKF